MQQLAYRIRYLTHHVLVCTAHIIQHKLFMTICIVSAFPAGARSRLYQLGLYLRTVDLETLVAGRLPL